MTIPETSIKTTRHLHSANKECYQLEAEQMQNGANSSKITMPLIATSLPFP